MAPDFEHDVFLSYSHEDAAWSERLGADLQQKGVEVFLDKERLDPGLDWQEGLIEALNVSRHLIVLWSDKAERSTWVQRELGHFHAKLYPSGTAERPIQTGDRRVIFVELEGSNRAYRHLQGIPDLKAAGLYQAGQPDDEVWPGVVARIARTVLVKDTVFIPVLLMTMTKSQVAELDPSRTRLGGPRLEELLAVLEIEGVGALGQRYGERRADWRPFGSDRSIAAELEGLQDELNRQVADARRARAQPTARFEWEYLDDEFWSSQEEAERVTRRLAGGAAVLVIDPLSLYHDSAYEYLSTFDADLLSNPDAYVLVLSPMRTPDPSMLLRTALKGLAREVHRQVYSPLELGRWKYARCGPNVGDQEELGGWLASAVGPALMPRAAGRNEFLDTRTA